MLIADIKNKLTLKEHNSEDFLTSSVFSSFNYLGGSFINEYINKARNILGESPNIEINEPLYNFWPWFHPIKPNKNGVVPDLIIYANNLAVIVEAKNYSTKSGCGVEAINDKHSDENIDKNIIDQLGREYIVGRNGIVNKINKDTDKLINEFILIYLTRDILFPFQDIKESIDSIEEIIPGEGSEAKKKIFWLNWQESINIFKNIKQLNNKSSFAFKLSYDLIKFLEKRDLVTFSGFEFIQRSESFDFHTINNNVFYHQENYNYWEFITDQSLEYTNNYNHLFYNGCLKKYWEYLENQKRHEISGPFFYLRKE